MKTIRRTAPWRWALAVMAAAGLWCRAESPQEPASGTGGAPVEVEVRRVVTDAFRQAQEALGQAGSIAYSFGDSFFDYFGGGGNPSVFVLPGGKAGPEELERMTEDLAVMSRILRKAAEPEGKADPWALAGRSLGRRAFDAQYLDGFGALFTLSVGFPLTGDQSGNPKEGAGAPDETWERTRREVQLGRRAWMLESGGAEGGGAPAALYDPVKVEGLREGLLNAFKHAANIRGIPREEAIVVAVLGPGGGPVEDVTLQRRRPPGPGEGSEDVVIEERREGRERSGTVMALRVTKGAVDDFASGKLPRESFVKQVEVRVR